MPKIRAAEGIQGTYTLTTEGNASIHDSPETYDKDAKTIIEFLLHLPSGTTDRVFTYMAKNTNQFHIMTKED